MAMHGGACAIPPLTGNHVASELVAIERTLARFEAAGTQQALSSVGRQHSAEIHTVRAGTPGRPWANLVRFYEFTNLQISFTGVFTGLACGDRYARR